MTKEIHDINTRALDFVVELIEYIFEYPDDDYMTMECLCRKLAKHGFLDKADGYYQTHDKRTITHECVKDTHDKTENNSEKPNNCEVKNYCDDCLYTDTCDSKEFFYACTSKATISKMEQVEDEFKQFDREDLILLIECQKERIAELLAKDEPTTQMKTQNSNLTFKTLEYCDICDHKGCEECIANALDEHCIPSQFKKQIEDECAKEYEELGLKELKELIEADRKDEPQTDCPWK